MKDAREGLVEAGMIRCYGWSVDLIERAAVFSEGPNCIAIHHQVNVLEGSIEMIEVCKRNRLASISRGLLAMGLLTGKYGMESLVGVDDVRGVETPNWMSYFKDGKPAPD